MLVVCACVCVCVCVCVSVRECVCTCVCVCVQTYKMNFKWVTIKFWYNNKSKINNQFHIKSILYYCLCLYFKTWSSWGEIKCGYCQQFTSVTLTIVTVTGPAQRKIEWVIDSDSVIHIVCSRWVRGDIILATIWLPKPWSAQEDCGCFRFLLLPNQ